MKRLGVLIKDGKQSSTCGYLRKLLIEAGCFFDEMIIVQFNCSVGLLEESSSEYSNCTIRFSEHRNQKNIIRALLKEKGTNYIDAFDEVSFFDDTFYGPFISFENIFDKMDLSSFDFWGITRRASYNDGSLYVKAYLQSYFITVCKPVIISGALKDFAEDTATLDRPSEKNKDFDDGLTWHLENRGFVSGVYVNDEELNSESMFNYDHSIISPYTLMRKFHMPMLRRDVFYKGKSLAIAEGEEINKAFEYVKNNTNYDYNLIWEDLLKNYNISKIKDCLNLNYVLSDEVVKDYKIEKRIVVVAHLFYDDLVEECLQYIENVPSNIDIVITSSKDTIIQKVNEYREKHSKYNLHTKSVSNRGRDIGAIFYACRDFVLKYDYLCFVHDKKTSGGRGSQCVGASFHTLVWDNMLFSEGYIRNIISLLNSEERLGLLSPPIPIHYGYENLIPFGWTNNYENAVNEAARIGIDVHIEEKVQPFAFSSCFWCKIKALEKLWTYDLKIEDFKEGYQKADGELNHALERLIIYVAQDAGYYSGIVENRCWAALMQQNLYIHLRKYLGQEVKRYDSENEKRIIDYLEGKKRVYVYGAGMDGERAQDIFKKMGVSIDGYIVSDEYFENCNSRLSPIIKLSDIEKNNVGIVIAMNMNNRKAAEENLMKMGINDAIPLFMERKWYIDE